MHGDLTLAVLNVTLVRADVQAFETRLGKQGQQLSVLREKETCHMSCEIQTLLHEDQS